MSKYFISDGISKDSIENMICCFRPQRKTFVAGETIMQYSDKIEKIGLVLSGTAKLYNIEADGNYSLLETYEKEDVFGELFYLPLENFAYIVEATSQCRILFLDYHHIITPCEKTCQHHSQLINNLFLMTAKKSQSLSLHLDILHQHTTRKKLLAYLRYVQKISNQNPFVIPMSLVDLAEYLCVDRAAMMRELNQMKKEGLIQSDRRTFFLCNL